MVRLAQRVNIKLLENKQVEIMHGNVSSLPFTDDMFDLVTTFESSHFWPNLIEGLQEIKRVLKPGGFLLVTNGAYKHEKFEKRNSKWAKSGDMALNPPEDYHRFLNEAGYVAIEVDEVPEKNWIAAIAQKG
jgi:ubiquinone/menaquinone biosynthesis C-methylase UbiE